MKGKLRIVLGLALGAAAIIYILLRVDARSIWASIAQADLALLTLAAATATLIFPLRAIRWKVILAPVDGAVPLNLLWRATAVGFALNNVLPARLGEIARAYTLVREAPRVGFPAAFASLVVDRLFDAVVIIGLLLIGLLGLPAATSADARVGVYQAMAVAVFVALVLFSALFALAFFPARLIGMYEFFASKLSQKLADRGARILLSFAQGLSVLRTPVRFATVLFWTILHWLVNGLAFWIGFKALGVQAGFLAALATQGIIALAVATPQAPGFLGVFQFSGALALGMYGVAEVDAYGWAFAYWAASFVPITIIGMTYFARMGLSLAELRKVVSDIRGGASSDPHSNSSNSPSNG